MNTEQESKKKKMVTAANSRTVSIPVTWSTLRNAAREHSGVASPTLSNTQSIKAIMATHAPIRYKLKLISLRLLYSAASAMLMFIHQNQDFEHLKEYWCRFIKERTERIEKNVESVVKVEGDRQTLILIWFEETRAEVLELWTQLIAVDGTEVLFEAKSRSYVGAIHKVIVKIKKLMLGEDVEDEVLALMDYYQTERVVRERADPESPDTQRALNTIKRVRRFEAGFFNLWHPSILRHQGWTDAGDAMSLRMMSKDVNGQKITLLTPISSQEDPQNLVQPDEESLLDTSTALLMQLEALEKKCRLPVEVLQDSVAYRDLMYFETEEISVPMSKKIIPKLKSSTLRENLISNSFRLAINADTGKVVISRQGVVSSLLKLRRQLGVSKTSLSVSVGLVVCTTIELTWETRNEHVDKELTASDVQSDLEDALYNKRRVERADWTAADIELAAMYLRSLFERGLLQSGKVSAQQVYGEYSCWRLIYHGEPQSAGKLIRYNADRPHFLTSKALARSRNGKIVVPLDNRTVKVIFTPRVDKDHTGGIVWHVGHATQCAGEELAQIGDYTLVPLEEHPIAIGNNLE